MLTTLVALLAHGRSPASAQDAIEVETLSGSALGSVHIPGDVQSALRYRDREGEHVAAIASVRWTVGAASASPMHHVTFHFRVRGDGAPGVRERHVVCREPLVVEGHRLEVSDVDGDGVAEVVAGFSWRCGSDLRSEVWAQEGPVDLRTLERTACGGDGEMPPSLRSTRLTAGARARWQAILRDIARFERTAPASARRARRRATRRPVGSEGEGASDVLRWRDRLGEHALVVSEERQVVEGEQRWALRARLFTRSGSDWDRVHEVEASDRCIDGDATAGYRPSSVSLTDWDRDGVQEVSFLHTAGCMTDYSPSGATLVILEGRERHEVRGTTWTGTPSDTCRFAPTLRFADEPIHALIRRLWPNAC